MLLLWLWIILRARQHLKSPIYWRRTTFLLLAGQPFYVMFLNARISRCQGCHGEIEHGCPSPNDIVLQHIEQVLFQNPNTGVWQLSRDLRNTYYHPRLVCIAMKYPNFSSSEVRVPHAIKQRFVSSHLSLLTEEFGLQL